MIDRNKMARRVVAEEGGEVNLSIAQVKEVQRIVLEYLSRQSIFAVWSLLRKVRNGK